MKRDGWFVVVGFLLLAPGGTGAPLQGRPPGKIEIEPFGRASFVDVYPSHKRACVIVSGDGRTYLGLYVFDRWGNCVARDDYTGIAAARDDLAVEWYPPEEAAYTVDVYNFGRSRNKALVVFQ